MELIDIVLFSPNKHKLSQRPPSETPRPASG